MKSWHSEDIDMKEWFLALTQLVQTTKQVEKNRQDIEKLWAFAEKAEKDAARLREKLLDSDGLNNEEFDRLTGTVGSMNATLSAVIQTIEDGDLKERIKSLKKGINRVATIRANKRDNED